MAGKRARGATPSRRVTWTHNRHVSERNRPRARLSRGNISPELYGTVHLLSYPYTQLPARDATPHGGIERSNRFPNDSFLTNWTSPQDEITWDIEVLADGSFEVMLHYTCPTADLGSTFELRFGDAVLAGQITEGHDPPLVGMEHDRVERRNSYVKDFKPLNLGNIDLKKGRGTLSLKALDVPGSQVMDFRLMMFRRIDSTETPTGS